METTVDKFGRIVIPKTVREHYGLGPGTVLEIKSRNEDIVLHPRRAEPDLVVEDGVLVFTGRAEGDLEEVVAQQREERIAQLCGRQGK